MQFDTIKTKTFAVAVLVGILAGLQAYGVEIPEWVWAALAATGLYTTRDAIRKSQVLPAILVGMLAIGLTGCATSDAASKAGQGSIDQNVRGGVFASYTGKDHSRGAPSKTTVKGTVDGQDVDVEVTSASPFVIVFGPMTADTDVGTSGTTADQVAQTGTPTTDVKPTTDVSGLPVK